VYHRRYEAPHYHGLGPHARRLLIGLKYSPKKMPSGGGKALRRSAMQPNHNTASLTYKYAAYLAFHGARKRVRLAGLMVRLGKITVLSPSSSGA
jgi:hypothetical protein